MSYKPIRPRVIPCLLYRQGSLVKTVRFRKPAYIGDAVNAIKIYNDKEVDELIFLDIEASARREGPDLAVIRRIADECFMPLAYGGGVTTTEQMRQIFEIGVEKIALNSAALDRPALIAEAAERFGSQSLIVSIDIEKTWLGQYRVRHPASAKHVRTGLLEYVAEVVRLGAGELMLNSVDRDGTWSGYDLELIRQVTAAVNVPVIVCGGASRPEDFVQAIACGAAAVAAGSLFVYQKQNQGVLINYPSAERLDPLLLNVHGETES